MKWTPFFQQIMELKQKNYGSEFFFLFPLIGSWGEALCLKMSAFGLHLQVAPKFLASFRSVNSLKQKYALGHSSEAKDRYSQETEANYK